MKEQAKLLARFRSLQDGQVLCNDTRLLTCGGDSSMASATPSRAAATGNAIGRAGLPYCKAALDEICLCLLPGTWR